MSDFLINTPNHKRWMLPDNVHYYNCVLYGDHFHITIWNNRSNELILSLPDIYIDAKGKWKDLLEISQVLAEKKFKKHDKAKAYMRSYSYRYRR